MRGTEVDVERILIIALVAAWCAAIVCGPEWAERLAFGTTVSYATWLLRGRAARENWL
jgi:hypothetical protein